LLDYSVISQGEDCETALQSAFEMTDEDVVGMNYVTFHKKCDCCGDVTVLREENLRVGMIMLIDDEDLAMITDKGSVH
jgi:hypothetical protein